MDSSPMWLNVSQGLVENMSKLVEKGVESIVEADRRELISACTKLRDALETPLEKTMRVMLACDDAVVLRVAMDLNLVDITAAHEGPITVNELAKRSRADVDLVRRIMRILIIHHLFISVPVDAFRLTHLGQSFIIGSPLRELIIHASTTLPTMACLPAYFASNGHRNPNDAFNGPWQFTHTKVEHYFEWLARPENAKYQHAFNTVMAIQRPRQDEIWCPFYLAEDRLTVTDSKRVLLVDVGGGLGHELVRFHERFSNLPGKLILLDLPSVISSPQAQSIALHSRIEMVGHDFFSRYPFAIRGAKAFYLRTVLHDWPDTQALIILSRVHDAMAPDSMLLIHEGILSEKAEEVAHYDAQLDWHMMVHFAGGERTESQWRGLLEVAGFEVCKVWQSEEGGDQSLIEAMKRTQ